MLRQTVAWRVTWLRQRRGWKPGALTLQAQAALETRGERQTFDRSTLYRLERGERDPEIWTVIALADALQTTTDFLLGRTNDPTPATGGAWPVPAPEAAPLVERLNALDPAARPQIAAALVALLDALRLAAPPPPEPPTQ